MFTDITTGSNSINGSGLYVAAAGYDPVTGLGSPNAGALATDLAAFSPSAISRAADTLDITAPLTSKTITYGKSVTLRGTLTGPGATPIPDRRVFIQLTQGPNLYVYHAD